MCATSAEVVVQRPADLFFRRLGRLLQERRRRHDHAVDAVAALRGLCVDEGRLHGMRLVRRTEAFYGDHLPLDDANRQHAASGRLTRVVNSARAALRQAASELGTMKAQFVAQDVEQRGLRICSDLVVLPVHLDSFRHDCLC